MPLIPDASPRVLPDNALELLVPFKRRIDAALQREVESLGERGPLRDACEYSLCGDGKRFRPALVLMMAEALGSDLDVMPAALAVEYLHTSSLIADDLPCMDDDKLRRGRPTTHLAFSEETALLASYALIASAYELLAKSAPNGEVCRLAVENVSYNMGLRGLTGGQYLDLHPLHHGEEAVFRTIAQKTGALFETSFVLGWLYGGGAPERLPLVKRAAHHLGLAFQMIDDLEDVEQDRLNESAANTVLLMGLEPAKAHLYSELNALRASIRSLGLQASALDEITDLFEHLADKNGNTV